jgi:hypothetical protein
MKIDVRKTGVVIAATTGVGMLPMMALGAQYIPALLVVAVLASGLGLELNIISEEPPE